MAIEDLLGGIPDMGDQYGIPEAPPQQSNWQQVWDMFKGALNSDAGLGWGQVGAGLLGGKMNADAMQPTDYNQTLTPPPELGGWAVPQYLQDVMMERVANPINPMAGNPFVPAVAERLGTTPEAFSSPFDAMKPTIPPPPPVSSIPGGGG